MCFCTICLIFSDQFKNIHAYFMKFSDHSCGNIPFLKTELIKISVVVNCELCYKTFSRFFIVPCE